MSDIKQVLTTSDIKFYRESSPNLSVSKLVRLIIEDRGLCQYKNFNAMLKSVFHKLKGINYSLKEVSSKKVQKDCIDWKESGNNASFSYEGTEKITNLEQALEKSNADLTVWIVDKQQFKCWTTTMKSEDSKPIQVQNYSCNLVFKRRVEGGKEDFLESVKEVLADYKLPNIKQSTKETVSKCGIINIYDAHIDKFTWIDETTEAESCIEKNVDRFTGVFDDMLNETISQKCEMVIFPVGNDFFNRNSIGHESTKKGTPQHSFVSGKVAYKKGVQAIIDCINKASSVTKIIVPVVEGNHDVDNVFYLGETLELLYKDNPNVVIQNCGRKRKYVSYGTAMFGFAHGDIEKKKLSELPMSMVIDEPHMFANATHREFFLGDIHHKQEHVFKRTQDFKGVIVRFLRSSGQTSKWEKDMTYIGVPKTAELFIYDKVEGLKNNFYYNI